jgi:hypothetical protein
VIKSEKELGNSPDLTMVSSAQQPRWRLIMGESKRRRERRERTIGEDRGLRPGEPMVLKFFSGHDVLDLGLKFSFQGLDEEVLEKLSALKAVAARATSGSPAHCLICRDAGPPLEVPVSAP